MKNYVRSPWSIPIKVGWADVVDWKLCYDWAMYYFGMKMYGIGLKERTLLLNATKKTIESRSSQIICEWSYHRDLDEFPEHPMFIRIRMKKRTCLTLCAWDGLAITFNIPHGKTNPDRILLQFHLSRAIRAGVIAQTIQEYLNRSSRIESGVNTPWVAVSFLEVSVDHLTITDFECQRGGASIGS